MRVIREYTHFAALAEHIRQVMHIVRLEDVIFLGYFFSSHRQERSKVYFLASTLQESLVENELSEVDVL